MASPTGIGASVRRVEDNRFITGQGTYTDDINRPGQSYGCFVRSPHAAAKINKVLEGRPHVVDSIKNGEIQLVLNTTDGKSSESDSKSLRQAALLHLRHQRLQLRQCVLETQVLPRDEIGHPSLRSSRRLISPVRVGYHRAEPAVGCG